MDTIDARGLSCPEPVVLTRNALKGSPESCVVLVDNPTARENVTRFARGRGYQVRAEDDGATISLTLSRE